MKRMNTEHPRDAIAPDGPIRILISSCLLGEKVRYDGSHRKDPFLAETLRRFVEYVPVCPEVECGFPTPREAMRLVGAPEFPRLVGAASGTDFTDLMRAWCKKKLRHLEQYDLSGYICKKNSPSSGMERIKVYDGKGIPVKAGVGIFTKSFMEHFPLIPVEDEGRLQDPVLREMFLERLFTLRRFRHSFREGKSIANLEQFHAAHRYLIFSHGKSWYLEMKNLVACARDLPVEEAYDRYRRLLADALSQRITPAKRADVLVHALGRLQPFLNCEERQELLEWIDRYRNRLIPFVVPVTLFRHHIRKHGVSVLANQVFLDPRPAELMLCNHV